MRKGLMGVVAGATALFVTQAKAQEVVTEYAANPAVLRGGPIEPQWRVRVDVENDSMGPWKSDRDYSSGVRITADHANAEESAHWQISAGQNIYTPPSRTRRGEISRPYAAIAYGSLARIRSDLRHAQGVQLTVGVTGPDALGSEVQNTMHHMNGNPIRRWRDEVDEGVVANLTYARSDVVARGRTLGVEYRAAVNGEAGVGTMANYARAGVTLQMGNALPNDVPVVSNHLPSPRLSFKEFARNNGLRYGSFATMGVRVMASDWTLDNPKSRAERRIFVPEAAVGVQLAWNRIAGEAALVRTGREYGTQKEPQTIVRLGLSARF